MMKLLFDGLSLRPGLAAVLASSLLTACGGGDSESEGAGNNTGNGSGTGVGDTRLKKAASASELLTHIRAALLERYGTVSEVIAYETDTSAGTTAPEASGGTAADVSATNVQESGVDEADRIKTDGRYLYVSAKDKPALLVYETEGATSLPVATVTPDTAGNGTLQGLYLQDGQLTALAQNSDYYGYPLAATFAADALPYYGGHYQSPLTQLFMFDLSQPAQPQQRIKLSIDGSLISSRMVGSRLYLALRHTATLPELAYPYDAASANKNRDLINQADLNTILPDFSIDGVEQGKLFAASDCFVSPYTDKSSTNLISLISIDVSRADPQPQGQCYLGEAETLYASTQAVYLATTQYPAYTLALVDDTAEVSADSIAPADNITTDLHKFALDEAGIRYQGSGRIGGHLGWEQNQKPFRLSEYQDVLRVITYTGDNPGGATASLYTLQENTQTQTLDILAQLPNSQRPAPLGKPGEQIYATRFSAERGYLVTFRTIDPLYILDLSDPADPFIISELEIDGYSDYLHPLGDHFLLGVGKDALADTDSGSGDGRGAWYQGVKLSLIDISSPAQPFEKQKIILGKRGSNTAVSHTHHALTTLRRNNQLRVTLPLSRHETNSSDAYVPEGHPAYFYDWTNDELVRLEIDTVNGVMTLLSPVPGAVNTGAGNYADDWPQDRAVLIGDAVHYLSGDEVISRGW